MKVRFFTIACVVFIHCFIVSCAPNNNTCKQTTHTVMGEVWSGTHSKELLNRAINICLKSANEGDVTSQSHLSWLYILKNNRKENEESYKWTLKAANNGHVDSQFHLGVMYEKGIVVKQDIKKAEEWYRRAAQNGSLLAQKNLANLVKGGEKARKKGARPR